MFILLGWGGITLVTVTDWKKKQDCNVIKFLYVKINTTLEETGE